MLLKVDCLPNAFGKQPSIPLIYLERKWMSNWWCWWEIDKEKRERVGEREREREREREAGVYRIQKNIEQLEMFFVMFFDRFGDNGTSCEACSKNHLRSKRKLGRYRKCGENNRWLVLLCFVPEQGKEGVRESLFKFVWILPEWLSYMKFYQ